MKFIYLFTLATLFSCNQPVNSNKKTPTEFQKKVDPQTFEKIITNIALKTILDVRTPEEFKEGNIQNSILNNIYDDSFLTNLVSLNKEEPILVYCKSGTRSQTASNKLQKAGFKKIYELKSGYDGWKKYQLSKK